MERACFPVSYKAGFVSTGTTGGAPPGIPQRHPLAGQTPTPFPTPKNMTLEKLADRDSINTKVFGKGGMGFVEGRGNFSEEKFPLPSTIFPTYSIYPAIKRLSAHPGHSRRTADAAENGQARAKGPHSCRERRAWPLPDHRSRNCSPRRSGSCPARP